MQERVAITRHLLRLVQVLHHAVVMVLAVEQVITSVLALRVGQRMIARCRRAQRAKHGGMNLPPRM